MTTRWSITIYKAVDSQVAEARFCANYTGRWLLFWHFLRMFLRRWPERAAPDAPVSGLKPETPPMRGDVHQ